jgi:hypothetical protein
VELLRVPALPEAFCHWCGPPPGPAVQVTSDADQVVAPGVGGVNDAAFAISEIRSCFVAVVSTMFCTVIGELSWLEFAFTFVTLNDTPAGSVTLACSTTAAVIVVVCAVPGSVTGV